MNKAYLDRFISKYSLGDSVNSVVWKVNDEVLTTEFITLDKSLLGKVTLDTFQFEEIELGIYDTKQLASLLSVLNDDINLTVVKSQDKVVSIKFEDSYASINYMLSDLSVIPDVPKMKSVPEFELSLKIDSLFITKFISGTNALAEHETFTVLTDENTNTCKFVINFATINTNRVTLPVTVDTFSDVGPLSFNAELFSKVLQANKECESASIEVSNRGLARAKFKVDNYEAVYNLVASQNID
jgi:hypothetical protein